MTDRLKKIDRTLLELWTGIVLFGGICQSVALLFPLHRVKCAIGLWAGVLVAVLSAFHMWYSLNRAFGCDEKTASKMLAGGYLIRYLVTAAFLFVLFFTEAGYVLAGFLGVMGLKAGAFLQPFTHKFYNWIFHEKDPVAQPLPENYEDAEKDEEAHGDTVE